jgi:hypothetical protein
MLGPLEEAVELLQEFKNLGKFVEAASISMSPDDTDRARNFEPVLRSQTEIAYVFG